MNNIRSSVTRTSWGQGRCSGESTHDHLPAVWDRQILGSMPWVGVEFHVGSLLYSERVFSAYSSWFSPFLESLIVVDVLPFNRKLYYINTNEIPGERKLDIFTCENNMLSSRVKISPLLWLHDKSRLSHQKTKKWNGLIWYFISVYIINRTLHGRLEIRCAHSWTIFQHSKINFVSPCGHVISSIFNYLIFKCRCVPGLMIYLGPS